MGSLTSDRADDATADGRHRLTAADSSEPPGRVWESLSRRGFLKWTALTSAAAASLGRLVGFTPVATALNPGNCIYRSNVQCDRACSGPCSTTYSQCTFGFPSYYAACVCSAGPGRCGAFFVSATCPSFFEVHACCFFC